jgi:hypothetical protein
LPGVQNVAGAWPQQGGATGSIRLNPEIKHGANAGKQQSSLCHATQ